MAASRHTHASCSAFPLVWGSLRLTPNTWKWNYTERKWKKEKNGGGLGTKLELSNFSYVSGSDEEVIKALGFLLAGIIDAFILRKCYIRHISDSLSLY